MGIPLAQEGHEESRQDAQLLQPRAPRRQRSGRGRVQRAAVPGAVAQRVAGAVAQPGNRGREAAISTAEAGKPLGQMWENVRGPGWRIWSNNRKKNNDLEFR